MWKRGTFLETLNKKEIKNVNKDLHDMILTINQSCKLSEEDVKLIKYDSKIGLPRVNIAKKYKIHRDTVSNIYTGKTWSQVVI